MDNNIRETGAEALRAAPEKRAPYLKRCTALKITGANSFDYLTDLQRRARELAAKSGAMDMPP